MDDIQNWIFITVTTSQESCTPFLFRIAKHFHMGSLHININWCIDWNVFTKRTLLTAMNSFSLFRDHFLSVPSQWEMMLQCNVVSHWMGALKKLSLPVRLQAITWINANLLSTTPLGTYFKGTLFEIQAMHLKILSAKCQPICSGPNVATTRLVATEEPK